MEVTASRKEEVNYICQSFGQEDDNEVAMFKIYKEMLKYTQNMLILKLL